MAFPRSTARRSAMSDPRKDLGFSGENLAAQFLRRHGYRILEQNYRCSAGEIDIVAREGDTMCFVEVKTRRNLNYGSGFEAVSKAKQRKIIHAALLYMNQHRLEECPVRFDVVSILRGNDGSNHLELLRDAFRAE